MRLPKGSLAILGLCVGCAGNQRQAPSEPSSVPVSASQGDPTSGSAASPSASAGASSAPSPAGHGAPACVGRDLDLGIVLGSRACAIPYAESEALRKVLETEPMPTLRAEATVLPDRKVRFRFVNTGRVPLKLPLRVHSAIDTFSVRAERNGASVSLEAATPVPSLASGPEHSMVSLDPGGTASIVLVIDETVVESSYAGCGPNEKCAPSRVPHGKLARGTYTLRIRAPVQSAREDTAAKVAWVVP